MTIISQYERAVVKKRIQENVVVMLAKCDLRMTIPYSAMSNLFADILDLMEWDEKVLTGRV